MKTCARCGSQFTPNPRTVNRQKYCGESCSKKSAPSYNRGRMNPWTERPCANCGKVFQRAGQRGGAARHCSPACKREAARLRDKGQRWKHVARRYGVTEEHFERMFAAQAGRCAICSVKLAGRKLDVDSPQVDHDHDTGDVREILCRSCNTGLGMFRDDPTIVAAAAEYLRRWGAAEGSP